MVLDLKLLQDENMLCNVSIAKVALFCDEGEGFRMSNWEKCCVCSFTWAPSLIACIVGSSVIVECFATT